MWAQRFQRLARAVRSGADRRFSSAQPNESLQGAQRTPFLFCAERMSRTRGFAQ